MTKKIEEYQASLQKKGILLNANECPENLNDAILREIQDAIPSIAFNRYPDDSEEELLEAYGRVMHFPASQILAGNGSDQMLGLLIGKYLGKGKKLYTFDPDFSMYDYYASSYEGEVVKYDLEEDGSMDLDDFIKTGFAQKVSLVLFSNPNNPSGHCLTIEEIKKIVQAFKDTPVCIDEAYMEFADETSALTLIASCPNLYVTRTLSKAYGFAGGRTGFLLSNEANMQEMKKSAVPYALSSLSMKAAVIVLNHVSEFKEQVEETKKERQRLYASTRNLKTIHFWKSQGNFLHGKCEHKDRLLDLFAKNHIVIRNYPDPYTFRISIGTREENELVKQVLQEYEREWS